ncbi:MAG: DUF1080 domain-containing protein [Phaeodactylibacter sp.]|nr:DUF1080 domain-containing protein [Phaeodactylibacter sp.]MCB9295500.1 DUF1080 domain-containing protein [Lewinellaceae bacterium]
MRTWIFLFLALSFLLFSCRQPCPENGAPQEEWLQLFNGKNLDGWTPKIQGYPAGENFANTFRVEGGLLKISYDDYPDGFGNRFGFLFYEKPFSYYRLRATYRFVGEQAPGAPEWGRLNSGLMIHGQTPESMGLNQDFPISLGVELLGGTGKGKRPTGGLCTPGTYVEINGRLFTDHCRKSRARTYRGTQWVTVEVLVLGDSLIQHCVDGYGVLRYSKPQVGGEGLSGYDPKAKVDGTPLTGGTISVQSESHPIEFKSIELLNLEGCTDPKALNYKPYYVKPNGQACRY